MLRLTAIALILGGAYMYFGQPGGLRLTKASGGSSYSSAAQPALSGLKSAAAGILN